MAKGLKKRERKIIKLKSTNKTGGKKIKNKLRLPLFDKVIIPTSYRCRDQIATDLICHVYSTVHVYMCAYCHMCAFMHQFASNKFAIFFCLVFPQYQLILQNIRNMWLIFLKNNFFLSMLRNATFCLL